MASVRVKILRSEDLKADGVWVVGLWAWPEGRVVDAHVWGQAELAYSGAASHLSPAACLAWCGLSVTKDSWVAVWLWLVWWDWLSWVFFLLYKEIAGPFSPKFTKVLPILLRRGLFPECWREANITSIPKGAPSSVVTEHRHISITPVLSKVYEKVISCRMISHLIQEGVFPGCQFAYKSGRGTCDLLLTLDHVLQSSLDRAAEVRVVQLDFSAAFDRINLSGLIYKLKSVGVGSPVLSVLEQVLSSRRHRVCVGGGVSGWSDVVSGVPQGSVLAPMAYSFCVLHFWSVSRCRQSSILLCRQYNTGGSCSEPITMGCCWWCLEWWLSESCGLVWAMGYETQPAKSPSLF